MSFLVRKLNGDEELVNIQYAGLVSNRVKHVVVARKHSIELFNVDFGSGELSLRKRIPVWDNIIDCKTFDPFGNVPGQWLVILTDSNRMLLVAFLQNLEHLLIEEIQLNKDGSNTNLSILPGTLCVNSSEYISFHTREGTLCIYEVFKPKDLANFEKALHNVERRGSKPEHIKLFCNPKFFNISRENERSPMLIESISTHPDDTRGHKTFSVLYRSDVYNYFSSYITVNSRDQKCSSNPLEFPEGLLISPVTVPLEQNLGTFFFGSDTIFLTLFKALVPDLVLDTSLCNRSGSTIQRVSDEHGFSYISKTASGSNWKVSAACVIERILVDDPFKVVFVDITGDLHLTTLDFEIEQDEDLIGDIEKIILKSWSVYEIKGSEGIISSCRFINQLSKDSFVIFSPIGSQMIKIDFEERKFVVLQYIKATPPILDLNLTGTNIPKLQIVGGSGMNSGIITTEFKGFDSFKTDMINLKLPKDQIITDFWKIADILIITSVFDSSFRILKITDNDCKEIENYKNLISVNGAVLDLKLSENGRDFIVVTENGVFKNGELSKEDEITTAVITSTDEIIYCTKNSLVIKDTERKHTAEGSCISVGRKGDLQTILVGSWDGSVHIYNPESRKLLHKSNLAIKSVLIKETTLQKMVFIVGDGEGNLLLMNESLELTQYEIGNSPVDILDLDSNSFLATNAENIIRFVLNEYGAVIQRGYLKLDPEKIILKCFDSKVYILEKSKRLGLLDIDSQIEILSDETMLPRLVRKSVVFPNHRNLSVFITTSEVRDRQSNENLIQSQIEVIENNTFKTKSVLKLDPGIEVSDVVNLKYHKELIDSYNEEPLTLGYQKVLSQCFVISCISHLQDSIVPALQLLTVDERGKIQYQCSSETEAENINIYCLSNHGSRLIIGGGDVLLCYKVEYSVVNSKFSLTKVSQPYRSKYFISTVKSLGPKLIIGDVIQGLKVIALRVKKDTTEDGTIFKFVESSDTSIEKPHFLTGIDVLENLIISSDSLGNVNVSLASETSIEIVCQFNICDKINVIKSTTRHHNLTKIQINNLFTENDSNSLEKILPIFILGSVSGCVYLVSLVTDSVLQEKFREAQIEAIHKAKPISDGRDPLIQFEYFKKIKGASRFTHGQLIQFVDGDLLLEHSSLSEAIEKYCTLL